MSKPLPDSNQNPSRNLTRLYIAALSAVAILSIIGQFLIQHTLTNQLTDSRVVNFAGKQRFKSQEISKLLLLIQFNYNHKGYSDKGHYLDSLLATLEREHLGLEQGDDELGLPGNNSKKIKKMFKDLNPYYNIIRHNASVVCTLVKHSSNQKDLELIAGSVRRVMDNEKIFLKKMDAIVKQYDQEAREKVVFLQRVENILLIITLVILMLEGLFIFRPAVNRITQTIQQLIFSERKASMLAEDLQQANESLKESHLREQRIKSASIIEGQENERKTIAMELHDGLGQLLMGIKFNLESLKPVKANEEKLEILKSITKESILETRRISFNLMPSVLMDFGIGSALKHLAEHVQKLSGISILYENRAGNDRMDKSAEVNLYRITQEALSNSVKYSGANQIKIITEKMDNLFVLSIEDNGKGFEIKKQDPEKSRIESGNGISNIRERVNIMDGILNIESWSGKGTKVTVKISLSKSEIKNKQRQEA